MEDYLEGRKMRIVICDKRSVLIKEIGWWSATATGFPAGTDYV